MKIAPTTFLRKPFLFSFLQSLLLRVDILWLQLSYFAILFVLGFFVLANLEPRNPLNRPKNYDLFFTSVSAVTVSSMSTVEMEAFSNTQLFILSILMLLGGEVFTSMLELRIKRFKLVQMTKTQYFNSNSCIDLENDSNSSKNSTDLKQDSMKFLGFVVLIYFLIVHMSAFLLVSLYMALVPSARDVLSKKDLNIPIFSIVTIISTFTNCGYLPTNENMMVFKKDLGLLVILIPLALLGNTLYPVFLRIMLLVVRKVSDKEELEYVLRNHSEMGYNHLLSGFRCWFLGLTSIGFIGIQFVLLMSMEWKSEIMEGLSLLEKVIGSLFQVVNTRHTGESVFDLSLVSPAVIVLFITLMYLPPYTYFLPREDKDNKCNEEQKNGLVGFLLVSPLTFLIIAIMLICITEAENMHKDPLNFSVLNIIFEVISGYGNVGFSLGYSCKRQVQPDGNCKDAWYGFAGRWNNMSKLILIVVMIFGRLKKFHKNGGKAWKLS
ncbi:hypothetical protein OSB04_014349 [Centaurea solstitialis]|uniref:Uncharacterized protein n=1 Tax=Centaurea solstitialis TaxID=347529 RepID=A0AA38SWX5_9ASTR|nr:hypothetical protein OSB04_014349 [Centaurea solstitialis]